jgi:hypothetical protein
VKFGYFLSCEEFDAPELERQAELAEDHGFEAKAVASCRPPRRSFWSARGGAPPQRTRIVLLAGEDDGPGRGGAAKGDRQDRDTPEVSVDRLVAS